MDLAKTAHGAGAPQHTAPPNDDMPGRHAAERGALPHAGPPSSTTPGELA